MSPKWYNYHYFSYLCIMRVLIVNTSERTGGAAVAANRLIEALNNNGVKAKMLVNDKETDQITVTALPHGWRLHWNFLWERFCIWLRLHLRRTHLFDIDIANSGTDITQLREFQEADVIHLHWINQGCCHSRISERYWKAENGWYGRCMTSGQQQPSAI